MDKVDFHRGITLSATLPDVPDVLSPRGQVSFDASLGCLLSSDDSVDVPVALPVDWFLRVAQTDPADVDALVALVDAYGSFGVDRLRNLNDHILDPMSGPEISFTGLLVDSERRDLEQARLRVDSASQRHGTFSAESLESVRAGVFVLARMLDLWERLGKRPPPLDSREGARAFMRRTQEGQALAEALDEGLGLLGPRVAFAPTPTSAAANVYRPPLLHVLVLQMADTIRNDFSGVRVCADDRCAKLFIRQLGRAKSGTPRKDSLFCSNVCARRFHQREYRARRRAAERDAREDAPQHP